LEIWMFRLCKALSLLSLHKLLNKLKTLPESKKFLKPSQLILNLNNSLLKQLRLDNLLQCKTPLLTCLINAFMS
jgi:hypothetical protein